MSWRRMRLLSDVEPAIYRMPVQATRTLKYGSKPTKTVPDAITYIDGAVLMAIANRENNKYVSKIDLGELDPNDIYLAYDSYCSASARRLAHDKGLSVSAVAHSLMRLEREGLIEVLRVDRHGRTLGKNKVVRRRLCVAKLKTLELEMPRIKAEFLASRAGDTDDVPLDRTDEEDILSDLSEADQPQPTCTFTMDDGDLL